LEAKRDIRHIRFPNRRALLGVLATLIVICAAIDAFAWVRIPNSGGPSPSWQNGTVALNLKLGCAPNGALIAYACWDDAAIAALQAWTNAQTGFVFSYYIPDDSALPCTTDGIPTVAFRDTTCTGQGFGDAAMGSIPQSRMPMGWSSPGPISLCKHLARNSYRVRREVGIFPTSRTTGTGLPYNGTKLYRTLRSQTFNRVLAFCRLLSGNSPSFNMRGVWATESH